MPNHLAPKRAARFAAAAGLTLVAALGLAACSGGNSVDGEYVGESDSNTFVIITVDGTSFSAVDQNCDSGELAPETYTGAEIRGTLSEDHTSILWDDASGYYITFGDEYLDDNNMSTVSFDGDKLTTGEGSYLKRDSSQGKALEDRFCEG